MLQWKLYCFYKKENKHYWKTNRIEHQGVNLLQVIFTMYKILKLPISLFSIYIMIWQKMIWWLCIIYFVHYQMTPKEIVIWVFRILKWSKSNFFWFLIKLEKSRQNICFTIYRTRQKKGNYKTVYLTGRHILHLFWFQFCKI